MDQRPVTATQKSRPLQLTFRPAFPQLAVLDETGEHLRFHEHLQEAADTFGGDGLAESFSLEVSLPPLVLCEEQGVMADRFHKEADEDFRNQTVQCVVLYGRERNRDC